jgi:hypothetical protein
MTYTEDFSNDRQRLRGRDHAVNLKRSEREESMALIAGRCGTMTVTRAMAITGRQRGTVLGYARELGEEFLPEPTAKERTRKGRERAQEADLCRLARLWA